MIGDWFPMPGKSSPHYRSDWSVGESRALTDPCLVDRPFAFAHDFAPSGLRRSEFGVPAWRDGMSAQVTMRRFAQIRTVVSEGKNEKLSNRPI